MDRVCSDVNEVFFMVGYVRTTELSPWKINSLSWGRPWVETLLSSNIQSALFLCSPPSLEYLCPRVQCVLLWHPAGCFEMISQFVILLFNKSPWLLQQRSNTEAREEECCCVSLGSGPCALWAQGRCRDKKVWAVHREGGQRGNRG